jgi:hypothetical protein
MRSGLGDTVWYMLANVLEENSGVCLRIPSED